MLHSNLHKVIQLFDEHLCVLADAVRETWAAEEWVRYNPTGQEAQRLEDATFEFEYRIKTKKFMKLSQRERLFCYKILRIMAIQTQDSLLQYILFDIESCKRIFENSDEYFYLSSLSDSQFAYEIDTEIMYHGERFYGQYFQKYRISKQQELSIYQIFTEILVPIRIDIRKQKPQRAQRHRGYRDHGSLGSELSRTRKDQSQDWSIKEAEEQRKIRKQQFLDLLLGFAGWC